MAVTDGTGNQAKRLGGNNPILLRGTANNGIAGWFEGPQTSVSFGDYYRRTSKNLSTADFNSNSNDDFVPDATENNTVPTSGAISFSDFRGNGNNGVIKEYVITQSGTNTKLDLDAQGWNSNLNKNVPKVANINGRLVSNTVPTNQNGSGYNHKTGAALAFDAEAYNLDIIVDTGVGNNNNFSNATGVFGGPGTGGNVGESNGKMGGTAMYVKQNSNLSNNSAKIRVNTNSGRLHGGGGGGEGGRHGNNGNKDNCRFFSTANGSGFNANSTIRSKNACNNNPGAYCPSSRTVSGIVGYPNVMAGGGWRGTSCNGNGGRKRCRGDGRFRGNADKMGCYKNLTKKCKFVHNYKGNSANKGNGGSGGNGKGSNAAANSGNSGNSGNNSTCNNGPGNTVSNGNPGNSGTSGASGGTWGASGGSKSGRSGKGGQGGYALYSPTSGSVTLTNNSNNKGQVS